MRLYLKSIALCSLMSTCILTATGLAATAQEMTVRRMGTQTAQLQTQAEPRPGDRDWDMAYISGDWVYQDILLGGERRTPIYDGQNNPATIMVCPAAAPIRLISAGSEVVAQNGSCATITAGRISLATYGPEGRGTISVKYRILAVHSSNR